MSCDVKFQLGELRIAAAVKFRMDELQIKLQKLDSSCDLHLHFPFYYSTNLRQLQLYEAVKFSAARILKVFKF